MWNIDARFDLGWRHIVVLLDFEQQDIVLFDLELYRKAALFDLDLQETTERHERDWGCNWQPRCRHQVLVVEQ